jgi:hypothetical protein
MDMQAWTKLFNKSEDDPELKKALAASGVKKKPKLNKDRTFVQFDLEGQGLALRMTDEAYLKKLDDLDIGEGPLILSGVLAYLDSSVSDDLYKGKLPYKLAAGMTRAAVRKILGRPTRSTDDDDPPILDSWSRKGLEAAAVYSDELILTMFDLSLPGAP